MNIHNPHRVIFSTLKTALVHRSRDLPTESVAFGDQKSVLVTGQGKVQVNSLAFGGNGAGKVDVTIHPGSYVDNQPLTEDSVEFSFGGHRYQSFEYNKSDSGANEHSLNILHEGYWRETEGIWPAN